MGAHHIESDLPVSLAGGIRISYSDAFGRKYSELDRNGESGRRRKRMRFLLENAFKENYCRGVETFTIRSKNLKDASLRLKRATKIVNGLFFIWCESEKNQIMVCDILSHSEIYNYSQA